MEAFLGTPYKLQSSENWDEYLKKLGVGMMARKMGGKANSTITVTQTGGSYTMKIESAKIQVIQFTPGQEVDEETADGRKVKTSWQVEGNKITQTQKGEKVTAVIVREFFADQMVMTCTAGDVMAKRIFCAV